MTEYATRNDFLEFQNYTRQEFAGLRLDMATFKLEIKQEIHEMRLEIANLSIQIEKGFKDLLKWVIVLMISFLSIMIAVIVAFLQFLDKT